MHVNIRSLNKNFDEFHDYIQFLSFISSVICLSESRIQNQSQVNIELAGYKFSALALKVMPEG